MIRLNVHLDDVVGGKLNDYCEKKRVSKTAVVTAALSDYLEVQSVRDELLERMKDPSALADMAKAMGVDFKLNSDDSR